MNSTTSSGQSVAAVASVNYVIPRKGRRRSEGVMLCSGLQWVSVRFISFQPSKWILSFASATVDGDHAEYLARMRPASSRKERVNIHASVHTCVGEGPLECVPLPESTSDGRDRKWSKTWLIALPLNEASDSTGQTPPTVKYAGRNSSGHRRPRESIF